MIVRHPQRLPLLAMGMIALLTGLWAGLLRLGWDLPLLRPTFPALHGPLMVSGFLGTLIGLERAVALRETLGLCRAAAERLRWFISDCRSARIDWASLDHCGKSGDCRDLPCHCPSSAGFLHDYDGARNVVMAHGQRFLARGTAHVSDCLLVGWLSLVDHCRRAPGIGSAAATLEGEPSEFSGCPCRFPVRANGHEFLI